MSFSEKIKQFFGFSPPEQKITAHDFLLNGDDLTCEMLGYWQEYQLRDLAFNCCVNLIANAIANCEFKTFERGKPVKSDYYYLLNVEPNVNENSTAFWKKVIYKLYAKNEALVVPIPRSGSVELVVADSWTKPEYIPTQENVYRQIQVGQQSYTRDLKEREVLHLTLNNDDAKKVVDALYESYKNLVQSSIKSNVWNNGQHMKVHVTQVANGQDDFEQKFSAMLESSYKPFLESGTGILPEFDGYEFQLMNNGTGTKDTRDIKALFDDIFSFTARGLGIPPVLVQGDVAGINDIITHWLTTGIDPLAAQISKEFSRKLIPKTDWLRGDRVYADTSTIQHFDMFSNAANIEKIVESAAYSINELREATGGAPLPDEWANIHWMTKNIATVETVARDAATESKPKEE